MEGGKGRCQPEGERNARLPAPPSSRGAQAGKAALRNGRTTHGGAVCLALAVLIFEAMLISPAGNASASKDDDPLADAASLYKVDTKALRAAVAKAEN